MQIVFSGADDELLCQSPMVIPTGTIEEEGIRSVRDALSYLHRAEPRAHNSFFNKDGTIANGIICLLDGVDTELTDCSEQTDLSDSELVLISTLHGG